MALQRPLKVTRFIIPNLTIMERKGGQGGGGYIERIKDRETGIAVQSIHDSPTTDHPRGRPTLIVASSEHVTITLTEEKNSRALHHAVC